MKVLVTGSEGLVGKWVTAQLLEMGNEVVGLDRNASDKPGRDFRSYVCDILDRDAFLRIVQETQPDGLIHLAARTDLNETKDIQGYAANIDGVRHVTEAIRRTPSVKRAIYTSSQLVCKVGYVPQSDTEYCPSTFYGESKVLTEKVVREEDGGGVTWCLVRPTTVWGPHMKPHSQSLLRYIQQRRYFHVGRRERYKSYGFAGNVAYQYYQLLRAPAEKIHRKTFYLADYKQLPLHAYVNKLQEELGAPPIPTYPVYVATILAKLGDILNFLGWKKFPFNSFRLHNILTEYIFDLHETEAVCGPLPYSFEEGVKQTAQWYLALGESQQEQVEEEMV